MKRIVALLFALAAGPLLGLPVSHARMAHAEETANVVSSCHGQAPVVEKSAPVDPCPLRCMDRGRESDAASVARLPEPESRALPAVRPAL